MVFIAIKSFADNSTKQAYPSLATISRISGTSLSQVRRSIAKMQNMGIIKVESRMDDTNNGRKSNLYTLYDSPEMWEDDFSTEDEDFKAVAKEIPDDILEAEYLRRRLDKEKEPDKTEPTKVTVEPSTKLNQLDMFNITSNNNKCQVAERYTRQDIRELFEYDILMSDHPYMKADIDTAF